MSDGGAYEKERITEILVKYKVIIETAKNKEELWGAVIMALRGLSGERKE